MKNLIALILPAAALFLTPLRTSADPVLSLMPDFTMVQEGQDFTLDVDITGVTNLYAYQFSVSYDPRVIGLVSASNGTFLAGDRGLNPGTIDNSTGLIGPISDSLAGAVPGISGSGTLASLTFAALTPGVAIVDPIDLQLFDSNFDPIASNRVAALVASTTSPEPSTVLLVAAGCMALARFRQRKQ